MTNAQDSENGWSAIAELMRQVRGDTLRFLEAVPVDWLTWAPAGTSNHILWHAGHAVWLQDVLCQQRLTGESSLPDGWSDVFGMNCAPVATQTSWPSRETVVEQLRKQLDELSEQFEQQPPLTPRIMADIIHGLHDEAKHQGEMYLLIKLCREGGASRKD